MQIENELQGESFLILSSVVERSVQGVSAHTLYRNSPPRLCVNDLERVGARRPYIELGPPWESGYMESFNGKLMDESLDKEVFAIPLGSAGTHRPAVPRSESCASPSALRRLQF